MRPCDGPNEPEPQCTHAICGPCWQKVFDTGEHDACPFCRLDVGLWLSANFELCVAWQPSYISHPHPSPRERSHTTALFDVSRVMSDGPAFSFLLFN